MTIKKEFTTFKEIDKFEEDRLTQTIPTCFNCLVRVKRFKVTVEEIIEAPEILQARLQRLWDHSNNYYDSAALESTALKLGYKLKGKRGGKNRTRPNDV